jgi:hypothetical protein
MGDFSVGVGLGGLLPPPPGNKPPRYHFLTAKSWVYPPKWWAIPAIGDDTKINFYCYFFFDVPSPNGALPILRLFYEVV